MKSAQDYLPSKYWLMKTEPEVYSIDDLIEAKEDIWDGIRNFQARNFLRDHIKPGHKVLLYHSNANPSGIAGTMEVLSSPIADPTAFDKESKYYDPKSDKKNPRWFSVTVGKAKKFKNFLSLQDLKGHINLKDTLLLRKGQRLSILPFSHEEFHYILKLARL